MEVTEGSCPLGLWHVHVTWDKNVIMRVRFHKSALPGTVPEQITRYLAGRSISMDPLVSPLSHQEGTYGDIYRVVGMIPYGSVRTYGAVAKQAGTNARVVGLAMKRNPTPLIIPCHRVIAATGVGGFTPDIWIKEELLRMEAAVVNRMKRNGTFLHDTDEEKKGI